MHVPFQTGEILHRHRRVAWCGFPLKPLVGTHYTSCDKQLFTDAWAQGNCSYGVDGEEESDGSEKFEFYRFDVGLRNLVDN